MQRSSLFTAAAALALAAAPCAQLGYRLTRRAVVSIPGDSTKVTRIADVDKDGAPDLLYWRPSRPNEVAMSFGRGALDLGSPVADFAWRRFNDDEAEDLIVGLPKATKAQQTLGAVRVYDGRDLRNAQPKPRLLFERYGSIGSEWGKSVCLIDANRDRRLDLLVADRAQSVMLDATSGKVLWSLPKSASWTVIGDFDRDGVDDVFASPELRSGRTGKLLRTIGRTQRLASWAVGDLTGDGVSEFVEYLRDDFKTVVFALWSGRGYVRLATRHFLGQFGPYSFRPFDSKVFEVRSPWGLSLADDKLETTSLLDADPRSRVEGALRWIDLDDDGSAERVPLVVDSKTGKLVGDAVPAFPYSFWADRLEVSSTSGGSQTFTLPVATALRGKLCAILGSASGRYPGLRFGDRDVPIHFDAYSSLLLSAPNSFLSPSLFVLPATGLIQSTLRIPALPGLKGARLDHVYIVFETVKPPLLEEVSTTVPLWIR